jgi:hypothetical protein
LEASHPWLAAIANRFECYIYNRLSFSFVPAVGTQESGAMAFCPDYDASDDNSTSTKQKLLSFEDAIRSPIWSEFTMHCSKGNLHQQKKFYTREANPNVDTDIRLYDTGNLYIVQSGGPGTVEVPVTVGEVWVSYEITFFTPQVEEAQSEATTLGTSGNAGNSPYLNPSIVGKLAQHLTQDESLVQIDPKNGFGVTKPGYYSIVEDLLLNSGTAYDTTRARGVFNKGTDLSSTHMVQDFNSKDYTDAEKGRVNTLIHVDNDADIDNPYEYYYAGNATGTMENVQTVINRITKDYFLAALNNQKLKQKQKKQEETETVVNEEKIEVIKKLLLK